MKTWRFTALATVFGGALTVYGQFARAGAGIVVPEGARVQLDGGKLDLACGDLVVGGSATGVAQMQVSSGWVTNVRDVQIGAAGRLSGGSGAFDVNGGWQNAGTFDAQSSTVNITDNCGVPSALFAGSTRFYSLNVNTAAGRHLVFASGTEQKVDGQLTLRGNKSPVTVKSSDPGSPAYLNLSSSGTQNINNVGVDGVSATGQWLAAPQANQIVGGNAPRWFGGASQGEPTAEIAPVPSLSFGAQGLLVVLIGLLGCVFANPGKRKLLKS